jgi:hypothetical protein
MFLEQVIRAVYFDEKRVKADANRPVERSLWNNHLEVILDSWPCHVTQSTFRPYFGWPYWSNKTPWWKPLRRVGPEQ